MIRFLLLVAFLYYVNMSWPTIDKHIQNNDYHSLVNNVQSEIEEIKNNPQVLASINTVYKEILFILGQIDLNIDQFPIDEHPSGAKNSSQPKFNAPTDGQLFSVYNVQLGDLKSDIQHNLGVPKRTSLNEYGVNWETHHDNYQNFFMVAYDPSNHVAGLYTNQDIISSTLDIKLGTPKDSVRVALGKPITKIRKGLVQYLYKNTDEYDLFEQGENYITVFYDKHNDKRVTAIQLISKDLEKRKDDFYAKHSQELKEGFEYQLFDLTNATRVNHGLSILTWDEHVRKTARDHSLDMAEKNYFDHTNLTGQSPFDRMQEDQVNFKLAGENLATGQFSSIFAHEGLMNSLGHRENILREDYEFLGVGVAFNGESQPYYTQNFYAD